MFLKPIKSFYFYYYYIIGDKSALTPGGVRIGTPALTTRGLKETDFRQVADFLHEALQISLEIQAVTGANLRDFESALETNAAVKSLKKKVQTFITQFPMPGFDVATMKYKSIE